MNWCIKVRTSWLKLQRKNYLDEHQAMPSEAVKTRLWVINQQLKELNALSNAIESNREKVSEESKLLLHWEKAWFYYQRLLKLQLKIQLQETDSAVEESNSFKKRRDKLEKLFKENYQPVIVFLQKCVERHTLGMKDLPHLTRVDLFLW